MTIEECYKAMEGDYTDTLSRLQSEQIIHKFLVKFLSDENYKNIHRYLAEGKIQEAFRAAHTLKGIAQNLGLTQLYKSDYEVTEALRGGESHITKELLDKLDADYQQTKDAILGLD